jgi:hypothetical protein
MGVLMSITVILNLLVAIQDFSQRSVAIWVLLGLAGSVVLRVSHGSSAVHWISVGENLVFLLIQIIGLLLYFSIREKKVIHSLDNYLGWGDIWFLVIAAFAMTTLKFVFFEISGLILSCLFYGLYKMMNHKARPEIPLAGMLAIWIILFDNLCFIFPGYRLSSELFLQNISEWITSEHNLDRMNLVI